MKQVTRYDVGELRASINEDGYLEDIPVVGRVGIQSYLQPNGSIRREFRPPEEVFNSDSLASFKGKPITLGHPGTVNAKNVRKHQIGTILGEGIQDGHTVKAPVILHDEEVINQAQGGNARQLSLGYIVNIDETPGEWNGEPYDVVQRNIHINHLAIVRKARAGNVATLNLDGDEILGTDHDNKNQPILGKTMSKLKLDSGQEFDVPDEVSAAFSSLHQQLDEKDAKINALNKKASEITVERDALKLDAAKARDDLLDAEEKLLSRMRARNELEKVADRFSVKCEGLDDQTVKRVVIGKLRPEMKLDGQDDAYINASFDLVTSQNSPMSLQRQIALGGVMKQDGNSLAQSAREKFLQRQRGNA